MNQFNSMLQAIWSVATRLDESDLTENIAAGLYLIYDNVSRLILYPVFTVLFFATLASIVILVVVAIKKYVQCELLLALKIFVIAILLCFVLADVYLVAFGKAKVFLLFLKVQKDIFFILMACLVGLVAGRIFFKGTEIGNDILP